MVDGLAKRQRVDSAAETLEFCGHDGGKLIFKRRNSSRQAKTGLHPERNPLYNLLKEHPARNAFPAFNGRHRWFP